MIYLENMELFDKSESEIRQKQKVGIYKLSLSKLKILTHFQFKALRL